MVEALMECLEEAPHLLAYEFQFEDFDIIVSRIAIDLVVIVVGHRISMLADDELIELEDDELIFEIAGAIARVIHAAYNEIEYD